MLNCVTYANAHCAMQALSILKGENTRMKNENILKFHPNSNNPQTCQISSSIIVSP